MEGEPNARATDAVAPPKADGSKDRRCGFCTALPRPVLLGGTRGRDGDGRLEDICGVGVPLRCGGIERVGEGERNEDGGCIEEELVEEIVELGVRGGAGEPVPALVLALALLLAAFRSCSACRRIRSFSSTIDSRIASMIIN